MKLEFPALGPKLALINEKYIQLTCFCWGRILLYNELIITRPIGKDKLNKINPMYNCTVDKVFFGSLQIGGHVVQSAKISYKKRWSSVLFKFGIHTHPGVVMQKSIVVFCLSKHVKISCVLYEHVNCSHWSFPNPWKSIQTVAAITASTMEIITW